MLLKFLQKQLASHTPVELNMNTGNLLRSTETTHQCLMSSTITLMILTPLESII
jgi:hypothetical protein